MKKISTFLTDLTHYGGSLEHTSEEVSSLIDTWLLLRDIELNGERNRGLYVLKSRGMAHSNQIQEFLLTNQGIDLIDVYTGSGEVLTGSARAVQQAGKRLLIWYGGVRWIAGSASRSARRMPWKQRS